MPKRVIGLALIVAVTAFASAAHADISPETRAALERGDYAAALRLLRPQAEQGDRQAQTNLAHLFRGGLGAPLDYAAAAHWYRRAADQGDAAAQNALGVLHGAGLGVAQNYAEAFAWYRRAAEQGAAEHQFDLAVMYDNGLGVEKRLRARRRMVRQGRRAGLRRCGGEPRLSLSAGRGRRTGPRTSLYALQPRRREGEREGAEQSRPALHARRRRGAGLPACGRMVSQGGRARLCQGDHQPRRDVRERLRRRGGRAGGDAALSPRRAAGCGVKRCRARSDRICFRQPRGKPDARRLPAGGRARRCRSAGHACVSSHCRARADARSSCRRALVSRRRRERPRRRDGEPWSSLYERLGRAAGLRARLHVDQSRRRQRARARRPAARRSRRKAHGRADQRGAAACKQALGRDRGSRKAP